MKALMERVSLLSLSFLLVSPFAISPGLPQMITHFTGEGYTAGQVELLMSYSSLAILVKVFLGPMIGKLFPEKILVSSGLILIALGGSLPLVFKTYNLILLSRILLGTGIGLINAKAITIISERFSGRDRVKMLGLRGSIEVMGSAVLTLVAGQLSEFGWDKVFAIYSLGLIILGLYWLFVANQSSHSVEEATATVNLTTKQWLYSLAMATYAGFVIVVNSVNTLRIPVLVDQYGWGTPAQSSMILSLMMLMGIIAGTLFGRFLTILKHHFMDFILLILGLGLLVMWQASNMFWLGMGALLTGLVYSLGVTYSFHSLNSRVPREALSLATTIVLLGCNLGGGAAAMVLQVFSIFTSDLGAAFLILGVMSLLLGTVLFFVQFKKAKA